jgi:large subunit ribosomal protein L11
MGDMKTVEALVGGGKATAGPPLGPSLGPLGVNVVAIVNKINELTKDYVGMKVPVKVRVDVETKQFEVEVGTPPTAALIAKELSVPKGSGNPKAEKVGNLTMEQVGKIARMKMTRSYAKSLKTAAKELVGVCTSMGVTIGGKDPREVGKEIEKGLYDEVLKE